MSSSSSKRRKVTVDIKQTKLERGSVFARLGNKDKHRKKSKSDPDVVTKPKKDITKSDVDTDEVKKKSKISRSDEVTPTKKSKESSSKQKSHEHEHRESRKSHRRSEERHAPENEESQHSRSKRKSEKKMENLIIEKRMSPMLVMSESRSRSPSSLSPKKKSKKHKVPSQDDNKHLDHSPSPEKSEIRKHKERGRSREKKKATKDSKKLKDVIDYVELDSQDGSRHSSKSKKSAKHKPEKHHSENVIDKKSYKAKSSRDQSRDQDKNQGKISPVVYDASSDEQLGRKHEKDSQRPSKSKRRKHETESQEGSPARHKKSKRHPDAEEEIRKDSSVPRSHSLKKKNHKEDDAPKRKSHKEDAIHAYSDFSPTLEADYSEMSQTSTVNDDRFSSDANVEKDSKRRSKSKKKTKKEFDSSSKPHYEVIDDDYSDDAKKDRKDYSDDGKRDKKKRKRKREEDDYGESPEIPHRYGSHVQNIPEKKPSHTRPPEKVRHTEKYLSPRDGAESYKQKASPHISNRYDPRMDRAHGGVKQDHREQHEKYRESSHKGYNRDVRDRRKDGYDEMKNPRDVRFSPERREPDFVHSRLPDRHMSGDRNSHKALEWHHDNGKRNSGDRNESIPRLMAMPHDQDRRAEGSRSSINKYPLQRKRSDQDYQDQYRDDHSRSGAVNSERNILRPNDRRRPPPLLPPSFNRTVTPSNSREKPAYVDNNRFGNNGRKFEKAHHRDAPPHSNVRDRKPLPLIHDDYNERPSRSSSHDSRSSHHHVQVGMQGKNRNVVAPRSPQSDRNSSRERKDSRKVLLDVPKYNKEREHDGKHSRSRERTIKLIKNDEGSERGRPGEQVRPLKRHCDESGGSRRSTPSQDHSKKRRLDTKQDRSPSSQRTKKEAGKSPTKDYDRKHKSVRKTSSRKLDSRSKLDTKKPPTATKSQAPEVDWNELPNSPKPQTAQKEKSKVLSKFTPGSILQRTGVIMSILPEHLINRINNTTKLKENAENENLPIMSKILQTGLNSYSDEKLRKYLLGYNIHNQHGYYPPSIINGRTYAASMKMYMRKVRMVEPL